MLRFFSRFLGNRAMLHSSTSRCGVTEFSVWEWSVEGEERGRRRENKDGEDLIYTMGG